MSGKASKSSPLASFVEIVTTLSIAVVLIGLLGKWHFLLDLASHFRLQAAAATVASCPILLLTKRPRWATLSGAAGIMLLGSLVGFWWPFMSPGVAPTSKGHRLLTMNVLTANQSHDLVIDYIIECDPDFIVLQETDSRWIKSLNAGLGASWPYHKSRSRSDNFGIAIYSKRPWESCEIVEYGDLLTAPSIDARFRLPDDSALRIIVAHPFPPMSHHLWNARNSVFRELALDVASQGGQRTLVAGDLNCSPWSYWYRRLLDESQLRDSAEGNGLNATWMPIPLSVLSSLCGLPIDHVLVGSQIVVSHRFVGPHLGSDHRPLIVDFD